MRVALLLAAFALLAGCLAQPPSPQAGPAGRCVAVCEEALDAGRDLSAGPCLGVAEADWVCDVAHSPREAVDDLQANQCAAYRSGEAKHFIEVTPECGFIRQV